MSETQEDLKKLFVGFKLQGYNVIFFDRRAIDATHLQEIFEHSSNWDNPKPDFDGVIIPVNVPIGKTLRECVLLRNPMLAKAAYFWSWLGYIFSSLRHEEKQL